MSSRVDVVAILIAVVVALAAGFAVAGIGYLLGAPAAILGAITGSIISLGVEVVYLRRQRRRTARAGTEVAQR
jgi:hypothetical protein